MKLTIVIPTINRYEYLLRTLEDLSRQTFTNFEVIIVDQTPSASPITGFKELDIQYYWIQRPSASTARNKGIVESTGEVIIFLDDDIIIQNKNFLQAYADNFLNPEINGIAGAILNEGKSFTDHRHRWSYKRDSGWLFFPINYNKRCFIKTGWAGNLAVRKRLAMEIGGMDENFEKGAFREEADFCWRYAEKYGDFLFDPELSIIHIGAKAGGLRTFKHTGPAKEQQHYDGQFYFLFKNVPLTQFFFHIVSGYLYFFHKKIKWYYPLVFFREVRKAIKGIQHARALLKEGPKYIR